MWLLIRSGTIHFGIISCILFWIFEGVVITSQMEGYFSVLLFSVLLCHIGLYCLFVFCFLYYFCNWSFRKTLWRRFLSMSFLCFSPINTLRVFHVEATWRLSQNVVSVVSTWNTRSVCRNLDRGFFSTDVFWQLWLFFRNKLIYYFY